MGIAKFLSNLLVAIVLIGIICIFEIKHWPAGASVAGILLGYLGKDLKYSFEDLRDPIAWRISKRKLERGDIIQNKTEVRISFAYLYRIKVGNRYFLVKNSRGTEKYQPVGGVYKFYYSEKYLLKKRFHVMDDNKVPIDNSSRDDYRLRMENGFLLDFVDRFNCSDADRENIKNIGREFREELIDSGILNWNTIRYRYCGRHMSELKFGEHFQIYELLLADIVELLPTEQQLLDLQHLMEQKTNQYYFASKEEIDSLGINTAEGKLQEFIADHTKKILEENETALMHDIEHVNEIFTVHL